MSYVPLSTRDKINDLVAALYDEGYRHGFQAGYDQAQKDLAHQATRDYEPRGVEPY